MVAIAIGALHQQGVHAGDDLWRVEQGQLGSTEIAGEQEPAAASILLEVEGDERRTEDVTGVVERERHRRSHWKRTVQGNADHL
jgi:hypothetical protein